MLSFSIAFDPNKGIGYKNVMPWHIKDEFKIFRRNTMYKNIESNVYGDRKQKLPEVVEFVSCTSKVDGYNYNDKDIVGKIEVKINDEIVHEENIYVKKGITLSFLDKVKNWFKNLW